MAILLLNSDHYRGLRNRIVQQLFDPLQRKWLTRCAQSCISLILCICLCLLTIVTESIYHIHRIGRAVRAHMDPFTPLDAKSVDAVSYNRPDIRKQNGFYIFARLILSTCIYLCLSASCAIFIAPITTITSTCAMIINLIGCPWVCLHHCLLIITYCFEPTNPYTLGLGTSKQVNHMNDNGGEILLAEPVFSTHADAAEFLHDWALPFSAMHVLPKMFEFTNTTEDDNRPEYHLQPLG